jgi:hypothetical protein
MEAPIRNVKDKTQALEERTAKVNAIQAQVSRLERAMNDEDSPRMGCLGWFFRRRTRNSSSSLDQAVFGHKSTTASTTASDRLTSAAVSMEQHAESLGERAGAARAKAKSLMAAGKRTEALACLKKAKQAESQHANAVATTSALERQIDMLAESALQKEVATALSASVAVAKKKTIGLMSKAEDAVDAAVELRDFAEDVSQVMGGLQTDNYDEDELLEELEAMQADQESDVSAPAAPVVAVAVGIDPSAYPEAPKSNKKLERKSLLSDDGAVEAHSESM